MHAAIHLADKPAGQTETRIRVQPSKERKKDEQDPCKTNTAITSRNAKAVVGRNKKEKAN